MVQLSVIIPAYKAEDFIDKAVRSVLAQSFQDVEIVIASDDGQDYLAVLKKQEIVDSRIRCVPTGGIGTGVAHARNVALDAAQGEFIAPLDADDEFCENAFSAFIPIARREGMVTGRVDLVDFDSGVKLPDGCRFISEGRRQLDEMLTHHLLAWSPMVFARSAIGQVRWDEATPFWEDLLFYAQCSDLYGAMYYLPQPFYRYTRREGSMCNAADTGNVAQAAAKDIIRWIREGRLAYRRPETADILTAYFKNRIAIEPEFAAALARQECKDYHEFMLSHPELFYRLPR